MLSSRLFCSLSSDRFVFWQQWQHKLPSKFICNAILSHCCCTANWTGKFFSISSLSALYLIGEIPMVLLVQTHKHTSRVGITTGRQLLRSYPGQVLTCKNWLLPCILETYFSCNYSFSGSQDPALLLLRSLKESGLFVSMLLAFLVLQVSRPTYQRLYPAYKVSHPQRRLSSSSDFSVRKVAANHPKGQQGDSKHQSQPATCGKKSAESIWFRSVRKALENICQMQTPAYACGSAFTILQSTIACCSPPSTTATS